MIAEMLARTGRTLLDGVPPDGRRYWAARFWDRENAERHPLLREHFLSQKETIAGYLDAYGQRAERVLEFACGTGEFTALTAEHTPARSITALDISPQALDIVRGRVRHDDLSLVLGDFWQDHGLGTADLVLCVDAIHHLGDVRQVLTRLRSFVTPGGTFIGNLWTGDNFHEFGRRRYGRRGHLGDARAALPPRRGDERLHPPSGRGEAAVDGEDGAAAQDDVGGSSLGHRRPPGSR